MEAEANDGNKEKRIFIGNPGVGKSSLLNSIAGEALFKSGVSPGKGLTRQLEQKAIGSIMYCYTPGLADTEMREEAGKAISQALKEGGPCKIFFVVIEEAGRVRPQCAATMKVVLDAAPEIGNKFGIIVNKCTKEKIEFFFGSESPRKNFDKFVVHLWNGIDEKHHHANIVLLERNEDLEDAEDKVIPADQLRGNAYGKPVGLIEFVNWLPLIQLTPGKSSDVITEDIARIKGQFETEIDDLENDEEAMENEMKRKQEMLMKERNKEDKTGVLYHLGQLSDNIMEHVIKPAEKLLEGVAQPAIGIVEGVLSGAAGVNPADGKAESGARNLGRTIGQAVATGVTHAAKQQIAHQVGSKQHTWWNTDWSKVDWANMDYSKVDWAHVDWARGPWF